MSNRINLIVVLLALAFTCIAGESGYHPYPYSPIKNTPEQYKAKRAALDEFRAQVESNFWDWHQLGYTESTISVVLKASGGLLKATAIKDPSSVIGHFNAENGKWYKSLPKPDEFDLTSKDSRQTYKPHEEYLREVLALAYLTKYKEQDHKDLVFKTLARYFNEGFAPPHDYNMTFTYGSGPNRTNFCKLLIMTGHCLYEPIQSERKIDPFVENLYQKWREYCRAIINAGPQHRGANWCLRVDHCLNYILFTNEVYDMDEYDYHWRNSMTLNRWERGGVFPDGSMTHHGEIPYWGKYGNAIVERNILYGEIFKGTPWEYTKDKLDYMANYMLDGRRWSYYRGVEDFTISGDQSLIKGDGLNTSELQTDFLKRMLALGKGRFEREDELKEMLANYENPFWTESEMDGAKPTKRASNLSGNRYLWEIDNHIHRRPDYSIGVKRNSQRTRSPEARRGGSGTLHLASGYTPILHDGDELFLARMAWDYLHIPGTTVEQGQDIDGGGSASSKRGLNLFSGGVCDSQYGCGAFEMNLVNFTRDGKGGYKYINGAGALKGTYFFEEGMLAVGQQINRIATTPKGAHEILTTINNVPRNTEVVYSLNGKKDVTVPLNSEVNKEAHLITDISWFHHDGVGYVIWPCASKSTKLVLSFNEVPFNEELKEAYKPRLMAVRGKKVGAKIWDKGTMNMFRLWINHGVNPNNDTYTYAVLPGCTLDELKTYVANPPVEIVNNSKGVQAVRNSKAGLFYASFANKGMANFGNGEKMKADRPMIVMAQKDSNGKCRFHAQNPVHRGLRNDLYHPGEGNSIGNLIEKSVKLKVEGFGKHKSVTFKFSTERGEEGCPVSGK